MMSRGTRVAMCAVNSSEEPGAVLPHAGICEGTGYPTSIMSP